MLVMNLEKGISFTLLGKCTNVFHRFIVLSHFNKVQFGPVLRRVTPCPKCGAAMGDSMQIHKSFDSALNRCVSA